MPNLPNGELSGRLVEWDQVHGCGQIWLAGERVAVDRVGLEPGQDPAMALGCPVRFRLVQAEGGELRVVGLRLVPRMRASVSVVRGLLALALVAPVVRALCSLGEYGILACAVVVVLSVARMLLQWADWDTRVGELWRVPHRILHLVEFLGGWPGAVAAPVRPDGPRRGVIYHGTLGAIVALYQLVTWEYLLDWPLTRRWMAWSTEG